MIAISASAVVILVGIWIFLDVFISKPAPTAEADFSRIEASIEKILLKADGFKAASGGASGSPASAEALASAPEYQALKKELEEKKVEVQTLKERVADVAEDNTPELLAKIKGLESRLAEYEIIEDDIADLSHYKEENERLKKQLAGDAGATSAPEAEAAETAAEAEVETSPIADDFSKAVDDLESQVAKPAEPVAKKAAAKKTEAAPASAAPINDDEVPVEKAAAAASSDVFAEYQDVDGESDPMAGLGDIDTNRMLEEIQGLEAEAGSADVLTQAPDVEKMVEEAKKLPKEKS